MAKKSLITKTRKRQRKIDHRYELGLEQKDVEEVRSYNRCSQCGRTHGYMRKFGLCRICFREMARKGNLMGVKKSSW